MSSHPVGDITDPLAIYAARSNEPSLIDSIVVFIDSLGTKDTAVDRSHQQQRLKALSTGIAAARKNAALPDIDGFSATGAFTDNIVIGFPIDRTGDPVLSDPESSWAVLLRVLISAAAYQTELIRHDIFVRGGIAVGPLWMDPLMIFGSGLNEAYGLEQSVARYPRIVVSSEIVRAAESLSRNISNVSRSWLGNLLIRGRDGAYFVNYLFDDQIASEQDGEHPDDGVYSGLTDPVSHSSTASFLESHREAVGAGLFDNQATPSVYEKYLWAARYHNFYCDRYGYPDEALSQPDEGIEFMKLGDYFETNEDHWLV